MAPPLSQQQTESDLKINNHCDTKVTEDTSEIINNGLVDVNNELSEEDIRAQEGSLSSLSLQEQVNTSKIENKKPNQLTEVGTFYYISTIFTRNNFNFLMVYKSNKIYVFIEFLIMIDLTY
jgi:hypothetical protein